jgi:WXG100 family type VII secretion target
MADIVAVSYDFGAVADAGSGLQSSAKEITTALQEMENHFQRFIETNWTGGNASEAFAIIQTKWQGESLDLNAKLAQIGTTTISGGENMRATDARLAQMLAG